MRAAALAAAAAVSLAGCHSQLHFDDTTAGETHYRKRVGAERALAPTVEVSERGLLRFATPLVCNHDIVVEQHSFRVTETRPNMATFIVGLIAFSAGAITGVVGLSNDDGLTTALGAGGLIVGAPFMVGPWIGNHTERVAVGSGELVQGDKDLPCGSRPLAATTALVRSGARQLFGTVSGGEFSVSPFTFVDAFALHKVTGLEINAELYDQAGVQTRIAATLDANTLARGRDGYFAGLGIDGEIAKLRKVPRVSATGIEVARVLAGGEPAVEIAVTVANQGPGDAYGVRGVLSSKNHQIDGRMVYVGKLAAGATATAKAVIHMRAESGTLGDAAIAVVILDAHDTTNTVPVPARGPVINRE